MRYVRITAAAIAALGLSGLSTAAAGNSSSDKGASKWKVIDYNRNQTHPARVPDRTGPDGAGLSFEFLTTPDTALLTTEHPSYRGSLLGDDSGKTLSATVGVTVDVGAAFTYYGEPDGSGAPARVRFYIQTDTSGKFRETDYWWSNPMSVDLESLKSADKTISMSLAGSSWSDYYGHFGNDPAYSAAFSAAAKDVRMIGLSFGGGCFFENGVGIDPATGGGVFRLESFTATP